MAKHVIQMLPNDVGVQVYTHAIDDSHVMGKLEACKRSPVIV